MSRHFESVGIQHVKKPTYGGEDMATPKQADVLDGECTDCPIANGRYCAFCLCTEDIMRQNTKEMLLSHRILPVLPVLLAKNL